MFKKLFSSVVLVTALLCHSVSAVDTPSNLLEKGIYTEETVGDLDKAIKIYEQIISQSKANRKFVAQAQLRLGKCLVKQGKKKEAEKVFRKLVSQFKDSPGQKRLVAEARKLLPANLNDLKLIDVPWVDGEHLEMRIKLAGGLEIGDFILFAKSGIVNNQDVWHLGLNRNIMLNSPNLSLSSVVVNRENFKPSSSMFRHTLMGTTTAKYLPNKIEIHTKSIDGKESDKSFDLDEIYYDNEQGWHLFRRLPLAEGYKATLPIYATFGSGPIMLDVEVDGIETLEVGAGKFECFKLDIKKLQQTFWISTDANRYSVKFEAGGVTGELQSIRQVKPDSTTKHIDKDLNFSISAPGDWYFIEPPANGNKKSKRVYIIDPNAVGESLLTVSPLDKKGDDIRPTLREWAEEEAEGQTKAFKNFKVVPSSWQERTVDGKPAISFVANHDQGVQKWSKYCLVLKGETTASIFVVSTPREKMDAFRKDFDKLIDTFKVD
ncbi:MAG: hypothetical protein COA78_29140 [Blastopirellula sp.]|nr:MAG: hypothetical protein COA78_29140 [Blastopirellula sp.]